MGEKEEIAMTNPWKVATIGLAIAGVTALSTGLTTAWILRPTAPAQSEPVAAAVPAAPRLAVRPAVLTSPVARPTAPAVTHPANPPRVTPVATAAVPADCTTGGERAVRIAKPAALGALLGAGLGAASGAIADGGKAAGKGALIGGIAGAALGTGYGAYQTKNECGTIFGDGVGAAPSAPAATPAMQATGVDRIAVYSAR
jgi:hypothetical protein